MPGVCFDNHAKPVHTFFGFFPADADFVLKIFARFSPIGFHIICARTGSGANQLRDKWTVDFVSFERLTELNDIFSKFCCSFF